MPEEKRQHSSVEVRVGKTQVRVEGSEDFVHEELPFVLEWVEETHNHDLEEETDTTETGEDDRSEEEDQLDLDTYGQTFQEEEASMEASKEKSELDKVANSLNVESERISDHFYVDEDGVGIQHPRSIDPKFALLGYGIIRKELTGETYLDNADTKEKLIDHEMVDIDRWGSNFLYRLRQDGLIKDDPNTERRRNKPFKITPKGFDEFAQWLENDK